MKSTRILSQSPLVVHGIEWNNGVYMYFPVYFCGISVDFFIFWKHLSYMIFQSLQKLTSVRRILKVTRMVTQHHVTCSFVNQQGQLCYKFTPLLIHAYLSITHSQLLIGHQAPITHFSSLIPTMDDWSMNLIITKTDCAYCTLHIIAYSYLSSLLITCWLVDKTPSITYINPRYKLYFFSFILGFSTLC